MTDNLLFEEYFKEKYKGKQIEKMPNDTKSLMVSAIMIMSYSEHEDKSTHTDSFKEIFELLKSSKEQKTIFPELIERFKYNINKKTQELKQKQASIFDEIIGVKLQEYKYLKENKPTNYDTIVEKLVNNRFALKENSERVFLHDIYDKIIKSINFPSIVLNKELLQCKIGDDDNELLYGLASVIDNPQRMTSHNVELEPEWKTFPLKWYSHKLTIPELRKYFKFHKAGKSLDGFIIKFVNDNLTKITQKLDNHYYHEFGNRAMILHNCVNSHKLKFYASSICTALPLIEGLLWNFAEYYNHILGTIFNTDNSSKQLIFSNGTVVKDYTIGDLLKRSKISDFFDEHFIAYYCDELYNERNPILHGTDIISFNELNSSKKILTIDYLTDVMNDFIKQQFFSNMDDLLGERIINKLMTGQQLSYSDKKEIQDKVKLKKEEKKNET